MGQNLNISEVFREYRNRLSAFIQHRVKRIEDAEDILQEVFYQLSVADRMFKPIDQMAAWLFTVARNKITDQYRKKTPLLLDYDEEEDEEGILEEMTGLLADVSTDPEKMYLQELVWSELELALSELPPEQREVFELTELQGMSYQEISDESKVPVNTLLSRKRYAVLHLRDRLYPVYNDLINQ